MTTYAVNFNGRTYKLDNTADDIIVTWLANYTNEAGESVVRVHNGFNNSVKAVRSFDSFVKRMKNKGVEVNGVVRVVYEVAA